MPLEQSDGTLLGVFCISQQLAAPPSQPARTRVQTLTERSAELEWLFKVTSNLKGAVDDKKVLEELLREATGRLKSALGVLYVPSKRLTIKSEQDKTVTSTLLEAWAQTRDHLMTWVQRQNRPLVVNTVLREGSKRPRCKVLCMPIVRATSDARPQASSRRSLT